MKTKIIIPALAVLTGLTIVLYSYAIVSFLDSVIDSDNGPAMFFIGLFLCGVVFTATIDRMERKKRQRFTNSTKAFIQYKEWDRRTKNG